MIQVLSANISRSILYHGSLQTLWVLHIHCLHVAVELLFRALLVVSLTRYAHTKTERYTLDAGFPDLLVQLRIETNIRCALSQFQISI
jgi:hypothetical protein